jgi:hypothetical protein
MLKREEFDRIAARPPEEEDIPLCENWVSKSKVTQAITLRITKQDMDPDPEPIWDVDGRLLEGLSSAPPPPVQEPPAEPSRSPKPRPQQDRPSPVHRVIPGAKPAPKQSARTDPASFQAFIKRQDDAVRLKQRQKSRRPARALWLSPETVSPQSKPAAKSRRPSPKKQPDDCTFQPDFTATRHFPTPKGPSVTEVEWYSHFRAANREALHLEAHAHDADECTFQFDSPNAEQRDKMAQREKKRRKDKAANEQMCTERNDQQSEHEVPTRKKPRKSPFEVPFQRRKPDPIEVPGRKIPRH